jgi:hypothetical protein
MKIDLSKKPEGATHINPHSGLWVKCFGGNSGSYQFFKDGEWEMGFGCMSNSYLEIAQPEPWTGEGLPPVGTVCEFAGGTNCPEDPFDKDLEEGDEVTIIAHFKDGESELAAFMFNPRNLSRGNACVEQGMHGCFRPIRTPEQIAAEVREKFSVELAGILSGHDQHIAVRDIEMAKYLYDAGYRKQVSE